MILNMKAYLSHDDACITDRARHEFTLGYPMHTLGFAMCDDDEDGDPMEGRISTQTQRRELI